MNLLTHLLSLVRRRNTATAHDDNLRAGKERVYEPLQTGHWNSLLL